MTKSRTGIASMSVALAGLALVATACGSSSKTASGDAKTAKVTVALTSKGCTPSPASVGAGTVEFTVVNKGANKVSEAELRTNDLSHIVGEAENLTPGLSGQFTVQVDSGHYKISCPGAKASVATFEATGASGKQASWQSNPQLAGAVKGYDGYVADNVGQLVTATKAFAAAVDANDLAQATALYPKARVFYERIEPVAEIWGDLDTQIDGRIDDFPNEAAFVGFHRLEQAIFVQKNLTGMTPIADGLVSHVTQLQTLTQSAQYTPIELSSGSTDLINEIESTKITGEEERYSRIDLVDFKGNLDGAEEAISLLTPYLQAHAPSVLATIKERESDVETALAKYQATPGYDGTGYVDYGTVTPDQRKQLSATVDALAEAVSKTTAIVGS